jgi:hypothetical protein
VERTKRLNNDPQNTIHKTKHLATPIPLKAWINSYHENSVHAYQG